MLYSSKYTNNIINKISFDKTIKMNKITIEILKTFFNKLKNSINKIKWSNHIIFYDNISKLDKSELISENIINNLNCLIKYEYYFELKINNHKIYVKLFTKDKNKIYYEYIKLIYIWFDIITSYNDKRCGKNIYLDIYLSELKKKIPKENKILDSENINSGYTYGGCNYYNKIVIYRKEEWFKVLIHESIHAFGLDFSFINNDKISNNIRKIFPINSEINSYESYCEVWATIWNCLMHAFLNEQNNFTNFLNNFKYIYTYECYFSYYQMTKVLSYMGLTYSDLYSKSTTIKDNFKEKTNVFAYFVLKTIIVQNLNDFLMFAKENNDNIIKFSITTKSLSNYCNLIEENYLNLDYKLDTINDNNIKESLRFTIFDIE